MKTGGKTIRLCRFVLFIFLFLFVFSNQINASDIYTQKYPINIVKDSIPTDTIISDIAKDSIPVDTIIPLKKYRKPFFCQLAFPFKIMKNAKKIFKLAKFPDTEKSLLFIFWFIGWLIILVPVYLIGILMFGLGIVILIFYISLFASVFLGLTMLIMFLIGGAFSFGVLLGISIISVLIGILLYFLLASFC